MIARCALAATLLLAAPALAQDKSRTSTDVAPGTMAENVAPAADGAIARGKGALLRGLADVWHPASLPIRLLATLDAESVSEGHHGRYRMARLRKVHEHVLESCFDGLAAHGLLREDTEPAFAGRALLAVVLNLAVREKTVRPLQHRSHDDAPLGDLAMQVDAFLVEEEHPAPAPSR